MRMVVALATLGLVACESPPPVFGDVLPDSRVVLPEEDLLPRGISKEPSEWATWLFEQANATNQRHVELLLLLEAISALPPNFRDDGDDQAVMWGPWIIDGIADQLWVEQQGDRYAWGIERQEVDPDRVRFDDDAWTTELSGIIEVGSGDQPLGGELVFNADDVGLGAVDAAVEAFGIDQETLDALPIRIQTGPLGRVALTYAFQPEGVTLTTYDNVANGAGVPQEGGLTFEPTAAGGIATTTFQEDRDEDGSLETFDVVLQWDASGGGRADVTTTSADGTSIALVECWGADHGRQYVMAPAGSQGKPTDCLFSAPE
ncbi:MAG: hypothetical protein AAGA48_35395 [Myxococcota bacterium]